MFDRNNFWSSYAKELNKNHVFIKANKIYRLCGSSQLDSAPPKNAVISLVFNTSTGRWWTLIHLHFAQPMAAVLIFLHLFFKAISQLTAATALLSELQKGSLGWSRSRTSRHLSHPQLRNLGPWKRHDDGSVSNPFPRSHIYHVWTPNMWDVYGYCGYLPLVI